MAAIWPALAIVAALASLAVLVAFWNGQLVFGVVIDLAILVVAFWTPAWGPAIRRLAERAPLWAKAARVHSLVELTGTTPGA